MLVYHAKTKTLPDVVRFMFTFASSRNLAMPRWTCYGTTERYGTTELITS